MVRPGIHLAESDDEKEAVYRFRYDVYVEEMGRYGAAADHLNRRLVEPEDLTARIFYAADEGGVLATTRFSWGGDAPFSRRLVEHYQLAPFLAEMAPERIAVGERGMVVPRLRGSEIFRELGRSSQSFISENRIELVFGACEPHLLSLYVGQGCRTFSRENINSSEAGFLIPLVTVVEDVEYLRRIGSPSAATAKDWGDDARIPDCVERLVTHGSNVISQRLTASGAFWGEVHGALDRIAEARVAPFDGLSEEQAERCVSKSNIIECAAGDRVLKKGGVARNMFVVLGGTLERAAALVAEAQAAGVLRPAGDARDGSGEGLRAVPAELGRVPVLVAAPGAVQRRLRRTVCTTAGRCAWQLEPGPNSPGGRLSDR